MADALVLTAKEAEYMPVMPGVYGRSHDRKNFFAFFSYSPLINTHFELFLLPNFKRVEKLNGMCVSHDLFTPFFRGNVLCAYYCNLYHHNNHGLTENRNKCYERNLIVIVYYVVCAHNEHSHLNTSCNHFRYAMLDIALEC